MRASVCISCISSVAQSCMGVLEQRTDSVYKWLIHNGLSVSHSKSEIVQNTIITGRPLQCI